MRRAAGRGKRDPVLSPASGPVGCAGKRQYGSFREATFLADRMRRNTDQTMSAYRGRRCQKWHIGHSSPTGKKEKEPC